MLVFKRFFAFGLEARTQDGRTDRGTGKTSNAACIGLPHNDLDLDARA